MLNRELALDMLKRWADCTERHWHDIPGRPGEGCYGAGYNNWGVQTNQKYVSAMAALAAEGDGHARERALAALRFSLASHVSGQGACTDGTQWGHTWISSLGVERMMFGVRLLEPWLTAGDRGALRAMLTSEAAWIQDGHKRGAMQGIVAHRWASSGMNAPESNLWNGAALWRAAEMFPEESQAAAWRAKARLFLVNSVCVPEDVGVVPGCVGGGFFSSYALDHHGYMNVGYMVVCVSNAAILHFDLKGQGLARPVELDHHEADLWAVLRRMIFADARLARIGGDTRIRYAYCQDYLLPALLYAADRLGDAHALELANRQLELIAKEQRQNPDGAFYGKRMTELAKQNPYYYTRMESDRACVLGMALSWAGLVEAPAPAAAQGGFEASVAGGWIEPDHGAALHRCPTRLASFAWRAQGLGQGMCLPPDDGDLAEWQGNMTGRVVPACHPNPPHVNRRLGGFTISNFDGGFVTCGRLVEGEKVLLHEGWTGSDMAEHWIAFAALPDSHTVVGLELVRIGSRRAYLTELQGLHLNVPNDLHVGFRRCVTTESGAYILDGPARQDEVVDLRSRWACVEDRIGVLGLYGSETLSVSRSSQRRGGMYRSLFTEEIGWPIMKETTAFDAGAVVLDAGWAVAASVDSRQTRKWAGQNASARLELGGDLRGVRLRGLDGRDYVVVANFGGAAAKVVAPGLAAPVELAASEAKVVVV